MRGSSPRMTECGLLRRGVYHWASLRPYPLASRNDGQYQDVAMTLATTLPRRSEPAQPNWLVKLFDYKPFLIVICLTPAIGLLLVFLTYPLGLGVWLAFTDTTIG